MADEAATRRKKKIIFGCLGLVLAAAALAYFFLAPGADSDLETKGDGGALGGLDINQLISMITSLVGLAIAVLNFRQARRDKA